MCCCGSRKQRRNPGVATVGQAVIQAYKERQTQQRQRPIEPELSATNSRNSRHESERLLGINAEVLKRADIPPPSYDSVVDELGRKSSSRSLNSSLASSSSGPTIYTPLTTANPTIIDADEERASLSDDEGAARAAFVSKWHATHGGEEAMTWRSKKEMKKAYKAVRKAEKWAMKAQARGYVF